MDHIKEAHYSRQLFVLGASAMQKLHQSKILIYNLDPLGFEISKNLILGGVKELGIYDKEMFTPEFKTQGSQFFLGNGNQLSSANDLLPMLKELNPTVDVNLLDNINPEIAKEYNTFIFSNIMEPLLADDCHDNGVNVILAECRGFYGRIFCDFGSTFTSLDPDGTEADDILVERIQKGVFHCLVDEKGGHELKAGDKVEFDDIKAEVIEVLGRASFRTDKVDLDIDPNQCFAIRKIKTPKDFSFQRFSTSESAPKFLPCGSLKKIRQIHLLFSAWNNCHSKEREAFLAEVEKLSGKWSLVDCLDHTLLDRFLANVTKTLYPLVSAIGGFVAQEAVKSVTNQFLPLNQWLCLDYEEMFPFLEEGEKKLKSWRILVVGAGAIGCEVLKNLAMMGCGTGENGEIFVTDMDIIERSNLCRQFLFRESDIGKHKSVVAANVVQTFHPFVSITPFTLEIGPTSEQTFSHDFFSGIDCVINALDNVPARQYMDELCVDLGIPLLESGTEGVKGHTQVIVPNLTKCYRENPTPKPKTFAKCTVTSFPYRIEHTIQYALDLFHGLFNLGPQTANSLLRDKTELKLEDNERIASLAMFFKHERSSPASYHECLSWGAELFHWEFVQKIANLQNCFPIDSKRENGQPFWAGTKQYPSVVDFGKDEELCILFITAAASIKASMMDISVPNLDPMQLIAAIKVPYGAVRDFHEKEMKAAQPKWDGEEEQPEKIDAEAFLRLKGLLEKMEGLSLSTVKFEKDDDSNHHVDFIHSASSLRAINYGITRVDRLTTKKIGGKIVPAIATTTSVAAGLSCMELYKLAGGCENRTAYRNSYFSLGLPQLLLCPPAAPRREGHFDIWNPPLIQGDIKLGEFLAKMKEMYNVQSVSSITFEDNLIYFKYLPNSTSALNEKIENIIQKLLDEGRDISGRHFIKLSVCPESDGDEEPAPFPLVKYLLN